MTGNIGIVNKPQTWIGKIIGLFTNGYSHAFIFAEENGLLYTYEMIGKGFYKELYAKKYAKKNNWVLLKPVKPYTDVEIKKIKEACELYKSCSYAVDSLFKHLYYKYTNHWAFIFKLDNSKICSEFVTLVINHARPYTFAEPETLTPEDIYNNKNFKNEK